MSLGRTRRRPGPVLRTLAAQAHPGSAAAAAAQRLSKRAYNQLLVRANLYRRGPMSRVELGQTTGLPLSALTVVCGDLIEQGFVAERGRAISSESTEGARGRPRTLLEIAASSSASSASATSRRSSRRWRSISRETSAGVTVTRRRSARSRTGLLAAMRTALTEALTSSPLPPDRLLAVGCADPD
jgi:hypothetical protein